METTEKRFLLPLDDTPAMPMLFLAHGNPMYAIQNNEFTCAIQSLGNIIPVPRAVLCISAHWETRGTQVTAMQQPRTIHDFGGFPPELFAVQYPAPGSPELAKIVAGLFAPGLANLDNSWGLDHGTWSVMRHLYPNADVPVLQMSLDYTKPAKYHYELAKELSGLRRKGILIVGSGNMVHNLAMIDWQHLNTIGYGYDWAAEVQSQLNTYILNGEYHRLISITDSSKSFKLAMPTPEHFLPLLYILALAGKNEIPSLFNDKAVGGSLTMTSVSVGL